MIALALFLCGCALTIVAALAYDAGHAAATRELLNELERSHER